MTSKVLRVVAAAVATVVLLGAGSAGAEEPKATDTGAPAPEAGAPAETAGPPEIVGGTPAAAGEFPYMVALLTHTTSDPFNAQFCGGALIAPKRVLTAAHCVDSPPAGGIDVLVGANRLQAGQGTRIPVSNIHIHRGWNPDTMDNDLATLDLSAPATQTPIAVIRPSERSLWATGVSARIIGWGALSEGGSFPIDLFKASVDIQSDTTCRNNNGAGFHSSTMFCAGPLGGGVDTCQGDSGGPISVGTGSGRRQIGIVSWGIGCARPGRPGIYTRLGSYATNIDKFSSAGVIPSGGGTATDRNFTATREPGEPRHAGNRGGASIWYRWSPTTTGRVTISTVGSNFDTVLGVYGGGSVSSLTRVASNDDINVNANVLTSRVVFTARAGATYRIAIDGYRGDIGSTKLQVTRG